MDRKKLRADRYAKCIKCLPFYVILNIQDMSYYLKTYECKINISYMLEQYSRTL